MMIQTVTGPVPVEHLGRTLIHEHLLFYYSGAHFDPRVKFDRPGFVKQIVPRLSELRTKFGVRTIVDPTTIECGRDVLLMKEASERSEVQIICITGFYFEAIGIPPYWRTRTVDEIAEFFVHEITHGIGETGVKPGAIKVSTSSGSSEMIPIDNAVITSVEKKFIRAACLAHHATGLPITTHTTNGCGGPEQQQFFAAGGVAPHHCEIGHSNWNADPAYHRKIVEAGSYIGFDLIGFGETWWAHCPPDETNADNVARLIRDGFRAQIMLSHDRACVKPCPPNSPMTAQQIAKIELLKSKGLYNAWSYLFTDFIPMLKARGITDEDISSMLEDNPRRFFAGDPIPANRAVV
ncbi:phosphotriesterase-related protein [Bradyrhizobium sp. GM22.5]